jgi:hypothetical protein
LGGRWSSEAFLHVLGYTERGIYEGKICASDLCEVTRDIPLVGLCLLPFDQATVAVGDAQVDELSFKRDGRQMEEGMTPQLLSRHPDALRKAHPLITKGYITEVLQKDGV